MEVWIIESLRQDDLKTGKALEAEILKRNLDAAKPLSVMLRTPITEVDLIGDLREVLAAATNGRRVMLHIEAHGDEDGVELTSGDHVLWDRLSEILSSINQEMQGSLVISVAACSGGHMARTVLNSTRAPFFALFGPPEEIDDVDLLNDFAEFFAEYGRTRSLTKARWALNSFRQATAPYYSSTHRDCFIQLYEDRVSEKLSQSERSNRIARLSERLIKPGASAMEVASAIATASEVVDNPLNFARLAWDRFVFLDLYPENSRLFPFPFTPK